MKKKVLSNCFLNTEWEDGVLLSVFFGAYTIVNREVTYIVFSNLSGLCYITFGKYSHLEVDLKWLWVLQISFPCLHKATFEWVTLEVNMKKKWNHPVDL